VKIVRPGLLTAHDPDIELPTQPSLPTRGVGPDESRTVPMIHT